MDANLRTSKMNGNTNVDFNKIQVTFTKKIKWCKNLFIYLFIVISSNNFHLVQFGKHYQELIRIFGRSRQFWNDSENTTWVFINDISDITNFYNLLKLEIFFCGKHQF